MLHRSLSCIAAAFAILLIPFANAWGASAQITTPSQRPYFATGDFSVSAVFRIGDDRTACPCSDTWFSCYAKWRVWLDEDKPNRRLLGWGEYNILNGSGIDPANTSEGSGSLGVSISGLDPTVPHTITAYLQDKYYVEGSGCREGGIFAQDALTFRICRLWITSFTSDKSLINPYAGEKATLTGSIYEGSGRPVTWTIEIKDGSGAVKKTFGGSGKSVSAQWDGKDGLGKVVEDGTYTATLIAMTDAGLCTDKRDLAIAVRSLCSLEINSFTRSRELIDPSLGESVTFTGDMTETSGASVQWTVTITDNSGAQLRKFSGSGKSVSVNWDGKSSFGRIVDDGLYTATLEAQTDDGKCKKTATAQVTVKSSCNLSSVSISPPEVYPQNTIASENKIADIIITLARPAPSSGCTVRLEVKPVDNTGGHQHSGNRPTGSLGTKTVVFAKGQMEQLAGYMSGEVAGTESIIAKLLDSNGNIVSTIEGSIDVKVPGLMPLANSPYHMLTGSRTVHPSNHYGTFRATWMIVSMASDYFNESGAMLGINDMSLAWGGLFDIGPPEGPFWATPHKSHRIGKSVDIDSTTYVPPGACAAVDEKILERIAVFYGGVKVKEPTIHYEFP